MNKIYRKTTRLWPELSNKQSLCAARETGRSWPLSDSGDAGPLQRSSGAGRNRQAEAAGRVIRSD